MDYERPIQLNTDPARHTIGNRRTVVDKGGEGRGETPGDSQLNEPSTAPIRPEEMVSPQHPPTGKHSDRRTGQNQPDPSSQGIGGDKEDGEGIGETSRVARRRTSLYILVGRRLLPTKGGEGEGGGEEGGGEGGGEEGDLGMPLLPPAGGPGLLLRTCGCKTCMRRRHRSDNGSRTQEDMGSEANDATATGTRTDGRAKIANERSGRRVAVTSKRRTKPTNTSKASTSATNRTTTIAATTVVVAAIVIGVGVTAPGERRATRDAAAEAEHTAGSAAGTTVVAGGATTAAAVPAAESATAR